MNNLKISENKIIYLNEANICYDIIKPTKLEVHCFSFHKDINITFNLNCEGSEVNFYFSDINIDNHICNIVVNHNKSNTISNVYNHGVNIKDEKLVFNVNGVVPKNSKSCVCNQENIIINLANGKSTIEPNLLIDNFDVSSSHSAYIGRFKDEAIFYLMSRGISSKKAIELMMKSILLNNGSEEEKVVKEFLSNLKEVTNG